MSTAQNSEQRHRKRETGFAHTYQNVLSDAKQFSRKPDHTKTAKYCEKTEIHIAFS